MLSPVKQQKEDFLMSLGGSVALASRSASKPHPREVKIREDDGLIALNEVMGPSQKPNNGPVTLIEDERGEQTSKQPATGAKSMYYLAYRKMWMINKMLEVEIKQQQQARDQYLVMIEEGRRAKEERDQERARKEGELEKRSLESAGSFSDDEFREKKRRRKRDEILREYVCTVEGCGKAYG